MMPFDDDGTDDDDICLVYITKHTQIDGRLDGRMNRYLTIRFVQS